jgi:HlyD family secretion protein
MLSPKRSVLALAVIATIGLVVIALRPRPVSVEVAQVVRGHFEETIVEDGMTRVRERFVVAAPIAGTLLRTSLKAGDMVAADSVVTAILPNPAPLLDARARQEAKEHLGATEAAKARTAAMLAQAEATAEQARVDAERSRTLVAQGAAPHSRQERDDLALHVAQRSLDAARFANHVAEHEVEVARAALNFAQSSGEHLQIWDVRSPVAGRVLRVLQKSQMPVTPGMPLMEIGDTAEIEVVADFLTTDAVRIRPGTIARIENWGGEQPLPAHVTRVEPGAFTKVSALGIDEQRTNVVMDIDAPLEARPALGDAYRVDARVVVATADDVMIVPTAALFREKDGWAMFKVVDGIARKQIVTVSLRSQSNAVVKQGLDVGDTVILFPTDAIADGVRIRPR